MSNRVSVFLPFLISLALLFLELGCKHPTDASSPNPPDTNWVTQPQVDISWPGLASSPWPMFLHDPQHTGRSPFRGPQEGKMEWIFNTGYDVYSCPAIDPDGTVYFGCNGGTFYALLPDGSLKWSQPTGGFDTGPLVAQDGSIYTYGQDSTKTIPYVFCYGQDGRLKWRFRTGELCEFTSPSISKDGQTIYIAAGSLYAIRSNGLLGWQMRPDTSDGVHYSLAISPDGTMLYAVGERALYAVDTSGTLRWRFDRTPSNPAVDNEGNVYFGGANSGANTNGDAVYSYSQTGVKRWELDGILWGPEAVGPVIGRDGTIYITGRALYAIDYSGRLKWKYSFPLTDVSQSSPAIDMDGTIYLGKATLRVPTDSVDFFAFYPSGVIRFSLSLKSQAGTIPDIGSSPAISADGKIYIGSDRPLGLDLFKIR